MNRFRAIIQQRCPVCLEGSVFHGLLGTNRECPVCGLHFERESGYYLNSMFIAYVTGFLLLVPLALLLYLMNASILIFALAITGATLILWPLVFRYSRVFWLHADQMIEPRADRPRI